MQRFMRTVDVANMLGLKEKTIRTWTSKKMIPHVKVGRAVLFDTDELTAWLASKRVPCIKRPLK